MATHTEVDSTELPTVSARPWSAMRDYRLPSIVRADGVTTLPAYFRAGTSSVDAPVLAYGTYASWLLTFDTSTHESWPTIAPPLPQDLEAALADLRATTGEAKEEGYPPPTQLALSNAKRILRRMYALLPTRLEVYPTPDGEVAIVAPGNSRSSVMVLCGSNGDALCMANMDGVHRRARYSVADHLPDGFLRDALEELGNRGA